MHWRYGPVHPLTQQMFLILGLVWRDGLEFTKRETGNPGGRNSTCQGYRKGLMCPEGPWGLGDVERVALSKDALLKAMKESKIQSVLGCPHHQPWLFQFTKRRHLLAKLCACRAGSAQKETIFLTCIKVLYELEKACTGRIHGEGRWDLESKGNSLGQQQSECRQLHHQFSLVGTFGLFSPSPNIVPYQHS